MTRGNDQTNPTPKAQHRTVVRWSIASFALVLLTIVGVRSTLLPQDDSANPIDADTSITEPPGADEDRSVVIYDPQDNDRDDIPNDDRPIFWTYAQFQLLADVPNEAAATSPPTQWMIDDQILSAAEVETYIAEHRQSIRQQGGLEFVCYNADYLNGVQGRLESWSSDASSNDWVELNRIPKAVAAQFTAGKVFPAPTTVDYQQCSHTVDHWNTLMGV